MSETRWPKFRLKNDTPDHRAGEIFWRTDNWMICDDEDLEEGRAFKLDNVDNFDEWFEPVTDKWPQAGKHYYTVRSDGGVISLEWLGDRFDEGSQAIGNVFKTEKSAHAYVDYLKAIATVRQDEGVIDLQRAFDRRESVSSDDFHIYTIAYSFYLKRLAIVGAANFMSANTIWFDTEEHADASCKEHQDEWKIIANYDWSRE